MATRTRTCEECHQPFTFEVGIGCGPKLCSDFCRTKRRHAKSKSQPLCVVPGCRNHRAYSSGICNACYVRGWRGGDAQRKPEVKPAAYRVRSSNGYIVVREKDHPLASQGAVYEHRKVLYDAIGPGPHDCHWCGDSVNWIKGVCVKGALVPDHLDGDKGNNALSNLVPACNRCNATRGLFIAWVMRHKDDPFLWEMYQKARGAA